MLEAVVGIFHVALPNFQRGVGHLEGQVAVAHIEQRLPDEPLVGEPYRAVPVAIRAVIGHALVNRNQPNRAPHALAGGHALEDALFLLGAADPGEEGADAVQALVEVLAAAVAQDLDRVASVVVEHVAEYPGIFIPGDVLQRTGEQIDVALVILNIFFQTQRGGGLLQDAGRTDDVRGGHHRGGAVFELVGVHVHLRGVVVPAARVVEVIPGLEQVRAHLARSRAAQPPGHEQVILAQARVEIAQQLARAGLVPQLVKGVDLHRHGAAVVDEGRLRVAGRGGVGIQAVDAARQVEVLQAQADEARVPGVQAVPALAGGEVADEAAPGVDGEDHVGQERGGHALLAEQVGLPGGVGGQAHHRLARLLVDPLQFGGLNVKRRQAGPHAGLVALAGQAVDHHPAVRFEHHRADKDVGEMPTVIRHHDLAHVLGDEVAQGAVQFGREILAHLGILTAPGQAVDQRGFGVAQQQAILLWTGFQFGHGVPDVRGKGYLIALRGLQQHEAVQFQHRAAL